LGACQNREFVGLEHTRSVLASRFPSNPCEAQMQSMVAMRPSCAMCSHGRVLMRLGH
jgi:hypothetical protein